MKPSIMRCLATLLLLNASSCVSVKSAQSSCSTLNIIYVDNVPSEQGGREGIFSITNTGKTPVNLPLELGSSHHIHSQYAIPEEKSSSNDSWRMFNPVLAEVAGWNARMIVKPDQTKNIFYYANGLFDDGPPVGDSVGDKEYSIVIMDLAGCSYRSEPFKR